MLNDEERKLNKVAEALGFTRGAKADVIGQAPDNSKCWTNGMDDIDNWAEGVGRAESRGRYFRPNCPNKPKNVHNKRR